MTIKTDRGHAVAAGIAAAAALSGVMAVLTSRRRTDDGHPTPASNEPSPRADLRREGRWRVFGIFDGYEGLPRKCDVPQHVRERRETGAQAAQRVRGLLAHRSRIDRLAWNTLKDGTVLGRLRAAPADWGERCLFLVSVGIAFEDMHEVLEGALRHPDEPWDEGLISRSVEAYWHLANARVPAAWQKGASAMHVSDSAMWDAWKALCDAVAEIVGFEPNYGRMIPND